MRFNDEQLATLVAGGESDRVEFKAQFTREARTKVAEAICAFANDLPGHAQPGIVVVGIEDDGAPAGLTVDDALLVQLAEFKSDGRIVPPPTLTVERRRIRGQEAAVVTVWPSDSPPVRFDGRIWIRTGARRGLASAQDERVLAERRRSGDRPFDISPLRGATLNDLDARLFTQEYLPGAFSRDVLDANERSLEERLTATKMIVSTDDPTPTVVGGLVLSPRVTDLLPGAYVQFIRFAGTELDAPIVDEARIDGPVADCVRRLDEKLEAHNSVSVDLTSSSREIRRPRYPIAALQQFTRNAVMHRTYEATNAPIRVNWFADRVEIVSPGGPFGVVTAENFGNPGITDYRNPTLAEAMKVLGFVQRFGVGISTARRALRENANPDPEIQVDATNVLVVLRAQP